MRANAALVFTEAFPVHDPDENSKSTDEAIQNQLDTVMVRTRFTVGIFETEKKNA